MSNGNGHSLPGAHDLLQGLREVLIEDRFGALLLLDVDNFHEINTSKGFATGDKVLAFVTSCLFSKGWKVYRIGGDEFGVIIEEAAGFGIIEESRVAISGQMEDELGLKATFSVGMVPAPREASHEYGPEAAPLLYSTVHALLFDAKKRGRNCLTTLPDESATSQDQLKIAVEFYRQLAEVNAAAARKMAIESRTDVLTGLYNRRGFEDAFSRSVQASNRSNSPLALI